MLAQLQIPVSLSTQQLDLFLDQGWFRMGQSIFTTHYLNFNDTLYSALWLRLTLSAYQPDNTQRKICKSNARFQRSIAKAILTEEKEDLFARYKQTVAFNAAPNLQHLLYGNAPDAGIYDTYEVTIHDDGKLIACGFFDLGVDSTAGICCFYDPAYKKYSLGKYLIYLKIDYAIGLGKQYFYPGYFVPGYAFFDYKLKIGYDALHYFQLSTKSWVSIHQFSAADIPIEITKQKLLALANCLDELNMSAKLLSYDFFDAKLMPDLRGINLLDYPLFISSVKRVDDILLPIIVYNVHAQHYELIVCKGIWKPDGHSSSIDRYSFWLLQVVHLVDVSKSVEEIALTYATYIGH